MSRFLPVLVALILLPPLAVAGPSGSDTAIGEPDCRAAPTGSLAAAGHEISHPSPGTVSSVTRADMEMPCGHQGCGGSAGGCGSVAPCSAGSAGLAGSGETVPPGIFGARRASPSPAFPTRTHVRLLTPPPRA